MKGNCVTDYVSLTSFIFLSVILLTVTSVINVISSFKAEAQLTDKTNATIPKQNAQSLMEAFIHETNEMLEQLDAILLESERAKSITDENINSIFRITHTIKGSAAMMSFNTISTLAHSVEDVFFILR